MPKLISIKRPFVKKTADLKNGKAKDIAEIMKSIESSCTELAKVASKIKRILKSSDVQKLDQLDEKISTLYGEDTLDEDQLLHLRHLRDKLDDKLDSKMDPLFTQFDDIVNKFKWFNLEFFSKPLSDAKRSLPK
ncbi:MAG: hypothetical protein J6S61_04945 [Elusimicrobiaceae bacterium]|nr:hypothetical protein [Elusimicrobiaceae bacterium]